MPGVHKSLHRTGTAGRFQAIPALKQFNLFTVAGPRRTPGEFQCYQLATMNMTNFKKIIYSIAQAQGMTVGTFHEASITPNFHACQLSHPHGLTLFVLCSINDDWAFAKTFHPMTWGLEFTDHSGLASSLRESYGIEVLVKKELDGPFSSRPYLHNYDIKHWKPKTLGEGLFNWWD